MPRTLATAAAFSVEGDIPIPRERALAILAPYTGESVRIEDLQNATSALEAELLSRGYSFYRVVLPPQSLDGVATIRVLPFRLANVTVTGNQHFSTENVLRSLPALRKGESPNVGEVGRNRRRRQRASDQRARHHVQAKRGGRFGRRGSQSPRSAAAELLRRPQQHR